MAEFLSTGQPNTLISWYSMCVATFGENSKATLFIKEKMDEQGEDQKVVADESQLLGVLIQMAASEI